jgi:histidinol-phosphate aminotransferase
MTRLIRPDLDAIPAYAAGRTVPGSLKLASNEVALPPPAAVLEAIAAAAAGGNRYPDPGVVGLTAKIAARHGVAAENVAVGCGSVLLCQQLVQIVCGSPEDEVIYAWRSFEAYPIVIRVSNARPVPVPLTPDHRHDLKAMAAAITEQTRMIFVCTPNNPTSTACTRGELVEFLDAVPAHVLVVLDEAYREFVTDPDCPDGLSLLAGRPNVVVLRTFSKAYRLAGLRVGYAVGAPEVVTALRKVYPAFSVSSPAQAAAAAALDCLDELLGACVDIAAERERVSAELRTAGFHVPPSQANFVWLPLGAQASAFAQHCEREKVILRPFAGDGVRVTVAGADENDVFLAAARSFRRSAPLCSDL